ncbi:deoxyribose-phosphate aldolase [Galbibacter mesophilus]|uniref:deoxyribose-phosphate aldolase n=1 Tax=Galbibacter mesophilus TaxID=379069 RepID=UPI00191F0518|nr:deoxyribose-phosphate aldolase [Galbibacter mesophilus]MCM5663288.1 deoxyribose-phosphate aldolase [Galbibacter mesophilus]
MIQEIAKMIDHSILHPTHTFTDLKEGCKVAEKYNVASICVKSYMVADAKKLLAHTDVKICCVIGFPAGNSSIETKVFETENVCKDGAEEVDMVINIAKALEGDWAYVEKEISSITEACHKNNATIKVIFETDYISEEKTLKKLCEICTEAKVDYVKTSTGFGFSKNSDGNYNYIGATIPHLQLMKNAIGPNVKVKASGGIRTLEQLLKAKEAGANRVGATATETIMKEAEKKYKN